MPSVFPGMDPFIEGPMWTVFHTQFAVEIARFLTPLLAPKYLALPEKRLVISTSEQSAGHSIYADAAIVGQGAGRTIAVPQAMGPVQIATVIPEKVPHVSVEIREADSHRRLVTSIEILSPTNKREPDRQEYLGKREHILASSAHLVEIDLLRGGERVPMQKPLPSAPYFVILTRVQRRPMSDVWPIALGAELPKVPIPLLAPDNDVELDLQRVFTSVYDAFGYANAIDYTRRLRPAVSPDEQIWVEEMLAKQK